MATALHSSVTLGHEGRPRFALRATPGGAGFLSGRSSLRSEQRTRIASALRRARVLTPEHMRRSDWLGLVWKMAGAAPGAGRWFKSQRSGDTRAGPVRPSCNRLASKGLTSRHPRVISTGWGFDSPYLDNLATRGLTHRPGMCDTVPPSHSDLAERSRDFPCSEKTSET